MAEKVTKLSEHFTFEELTASEIAARNGIDNIPDPTSLDNLKRLAEFLEKVRTLFNQPIHINSAYRSLRVNTLLGSKPTSDHVKGCAADIVIPSFGSPDQVIRKIMASNLPYKQCIREFDRWVHISIPDKGVDGKRQNLIIDASGTRIYE